MSATYTSTLVWRGWSGMFRAAGRMPDVFALSAVILFALHIAGAWALQTSLAFPGSAAALAHPRMIGWLHPVILELNSVPLALVAIAVHRAVLLSEESYFSDLLNIRLLHFLVWPVVLQFAVVLIYGASIVLTFSVLPFAPYLLLPPAALMLWVIIVRCSLIFPAIAADGDGSLGASWALTRGRAWRIFWAASWGLAPLVVFQLVTARVLGFFGLRGGVMFSWPGIGSIFLTAALEVAFAGVLAAVLSGAYAEARGR